MLRRRGRLAGRAPVSRAIGVALPARANRAPAPSARAARATIDAPRRPRAFQSARHHPVGRIEERRKLLVGHIANGEPGREPTLPERLGRPHVPDPGHELLALQSLGQGQLGSLPKSRGHGLEVRRALEDVGTEPPDDVRHPAREPARSTARLRASPSGESTTVLPRMVSPRGRTRQRPRIRRWLRSVTPPSKWSRRFLPTASTPSNRLPSSLPAMFSAAARGWGVSTSTRSPTRGCRRRAARWMLSPSGTFSRRQSARGLVPGLAPGRSPRPPRRSSSSLRSSSSRPSSRWSSARPSCRCPASK